MIIFFWSSPSRPPRIVEHREARPPVPRYFTRLREEEGRPRDDHAGGAELVRDVADLVLRGDAAAFAPVGAGCTDDPDADAGGEEAKSSL